MRAASHKIHSGKFLKSIVRTLVQHLPKIMRKIKCGAAVYFVLIFPIVRGEHAFVANFFSHIVNSDAFKLIKRDLSKAWCLSSPVDVGMTVRHRHENVEGAHTTRCETRIGNAGILNIHRRITSYSVMFFNIRKILTIVLGEVNRVMRHVFIDSVETEIKHER